MSNLIEILIKANADQATNIIKGFSDSLDGIGQTAVRVGTSLTMITAPITAYLATSLKAASDQQTALAQLESVIKSTGGAAGVTADMANGLAESLSKVTRFGDDAILSAENMLLTFTKINQDIFPDTTKIVLDVATALGTDLKSAALQVGKALNDPIGGLNALRRSGVQFSDAQQAMIEGMVKSGDLMGAQVEILKELRKEFGGSAEAAGKTFAGQMDILNNKFGELQETIGFALMPLLEGLVETFGSVIDSVAAWVQENPVLVSALTALAAVLVVAGPALIIVGSAISAIATISAAAGPIIAVVGAAFSALAAPIAAVVAGLALLKLAYDNNFLGFKDTVDGIVGSFQYLPGRLETFFSEIAFYAGYHFGKLKDFFEQNVVAPIRGLGVIAGEALKPVVNWFEMILKPKLQQVIGWLDTNIGQPLRDLWDDLQPLVATVGNYVKGLFAPIVAFIDNALDSFERLKRMGGADPSRLLPGEIAPGRPGNPFFGAPGATPPGLGAVPPNWLSEVLAEVLKPALISNAPRSGMIDEMVDRYFQNIGKGFESNKQGALEKGKALGETTIKKVTEVTESAHKGILDQQSKAFAAGASVGQVTGDVIRSLGNQAASGVQSTWDSIHSTGVSIGAAIRAAIDGARTSLLNGVNGGIGAAVGGVIGGGSGGSGMPPGWVPLPVPTVPQGGGGSAAMSVSSALSQILSPLSGYNGAMIPLSEAASARDRLTALPPASSAPNTYASMGGGGGGLTWIGDLVVQGGGQVNITKEQFFEWMDEWYMELDDG